MMEKKDNKETINSIILDVEKTLEKYKDTKDLKQQYARIRILKKKRGLE